MAEKSLADITPTDKAELPKLKTYRCGNCGAEMVASEANYCDSCMMDSIERLYGQFSQLVEVIEGAGIDTDDLPTNASKPDLSKMAPKRRFDYLPKKPILELRNELDKLISNHNPRGDKSLYGGLKYTRTQFERVLKNHPVTYHHKD